MRNSKPLLPAAMLMLLALMLPVFAFAQPAPERVEPPFWWAGMYHSELQVMVYGKDIGLTRLELDHPGVVVKEVVAVESPNYLFVYLDLSEAQPGTIRMNFRSGRRVLFSYDFELRQREEGSRYRQGFDASDAMYLLMPDRFANGDLTNDDMPGMLEKADRSNPDGRHGGDIQGIINHLDYISDLGFTALWINPLLENNQPRYSYHGYATTDYYKIDPRFGTNEDFRRLVQEAEGKGLKIIKDMIFNHSGHYHWWMKDLPTSDWLNQWPEFTRTTYRMTTLVDPYAAYSDSKRMVDGWFDTNMPDLNQRNRLLATYLIQNSVWWIEFAALKGIRMDTQPYSDKYFMSYWGRYVLDEYPNFNIVGEAWMGIPAMISYFQGGKMNHDGYDSNIPSVFDFSLYDEIGRAFQEDHGWASGMMRLYNSLAMDFLYPNPYNLVIFGDNHDTDRFFTRVGEDLSNQKMALTFLLTTRGIPQIYSGTELLKAAYEHDGHGPMRSNFPGGWPGDPVNAFTREGRSPQQNEIFDHIRSLLHYRKDNPVLHYGWLKHFVPENNVYVYFRFNDNQRIMVLMNNNPEPVQLELSKYTEGWEGAREAVEVLTGKRHTAFDQWIIPAKTAEVFELK
ncbi:MAG: glycoside hydrolase family 13 protein [Bacteroidales bacterium]|nr:glycoside hydrolase family 13 protein [Bacteroidales bacterium]